MLCELAIMDGGLRIGGAGIRGVGNGILAGRYLTDLLRDEARSQARPSGLADTLRRTGRDARVEIPREGRPR